MINFALNNTKYVLSLNKHVIELLGRLNGKSHLLHHTDKTFHVTVTYIYQRHIGKKL